MSICATTTIYTLCAFEICVAIFTYILSMLYICYTCDVYILYIVCILYTMFAMSVYDVWGIHVHILIYSWVLYRQAHIITNIMHVLLEQIVEHSDQVCMATQQHTTPSKMAGVGVGVGYWPFRCVPAATCWSSEQPGYRARSCSATVSVSTHH